jgi:hypothetical protein
VLSLSKQAALLVQRDDDRAPGQAGDVARAAAAGKAHLWMPRVRADGGAVDVAETIHLRAAQKADVHAAGLEHVGEDLVQPGRHGRAAHHARVAHRHRQVAELAGNRAGLEDDAAARRACVEPVETWVRCASIVPSIGSPVPAKTISPSAISRAAATVINSVRE